MQGRKDGILKAEHDKIEAERQDVIRRQQRKIARETRAKREAREKFKATVERNVILKGEVVNVL